jgi:hypothetical protein
VVDRGDTGIQRTQHKNQPYHWGVESRIECQPDGGCPGGQLSDDEERPAIHRVDE